MGRRWAFIARYRSAASGPPIEAPSRKPVEKDRTENTVTRAGNGMLSRGCNESSVPNGVPREGICIGGSIASYVDGAGIDIGMLERGDDGVVAIEPASVAKRPCWRPGEEMASTCPAGSELLLEGKMLQPMFAGGVENLPTQKKVRRASAEELAWGTRSSMRRNHLWPLLGRCCLDGALAPRGWRD